MNIIQGKKLSLLKRTSINNINNILEKNHEWKILDIGCGFRPNKNATVIADKKDFSNFYNKKKFVQIKNKILPFKDKEFDYVIASHVIEHVDDFEFFIKELERVANKGYIELPTRFGDNLVFENKKDHIWWFVFDDIENKLIASKKNQIIKPFVTVSMAKKFETLFRESFVIELAWETKIDYVINNDIKNEGVKKISFLGIIKKYLSKKIRSLFN